MGIYSFKFNIGDRVKNVAHGWNSTCCNQDHDRKALNIEGIIIRRKWSSGANMCSYAVQWDNNRLCGKDGNQLELVCSGNYEIY